MEALTAYFQKFINQYIGPDTINRGLLLAGATILVLWVLYRLTAKALRKYMKYRAHKPDNVQNFFLVYRYAWAGLGLILVIVSLSGSLATLGISAAFLGMILGWSLQAPVTGIAAWLMIILKRPFKIGDRIIISGIIGDVTNITLTHVYLNQVGGTISGEEKSGRGVLIPNAILFQQIIHNYTLATRYLLDEVTLTVTFDADTKAAEEILTSAAKQVTRAVIEKTEFEPFVHMEIGDSGIRFRLRYKTFATERQKTSSDISRLIVAAFNKNKKVRFAYPHSEVIYRERAGSKAPAPLE